MLAGLALTALLYYWHKHAKELEKKLGHLVGLWYSGSPSFLMDEG